MNNILFRTWALIRNLINVSSFKVKHFIMSLSQRAWFRFNRGLRKCQSVFLKIPHYGRSRRWLQLFQSYSCKHWYENWYLHFYKICDNQIWHVVTSREVDSNETNQAGASDAITSISHDKLKPFYLHYKSVYGHKAWPDGTLSWSHKVT